MRQIFLIALGAIAAVSAIVVGFTYTQVNETRVNLSADLLYRTRLLADSLKESVEPGLLGNSTTTLQRIVDKFADRERIVGLAVFNDRAFPLASSKGLPARITENPDFVFAALNKKTDSSLFEKVSGAPLHLFTAPLYDREKIISGALTIVQNASYIEAAATDIWRQNMLRLAAYIFIISAALALFFYTVIYRPIKRLARTIKTARGSAGKSSAEETGAAAPSFFRPLAEEINKLTKGLMQARRTASEEARLRLEKLDSPWTAERLKEFIKAHLKDRKIFLAFNREPYSHYRVGSTIVVRSPAGGASTALEPLMEACGGLWISWGSGDADRETADRNGKLPVPPEEPRYTLKRIWLVDAEVKGFYRGFSTEGLWPLCLMTHVRPVFRKEDWNHYRRVNEKYAASLLAEMEGVSHPLILVNDYHLALLPRLIKSARPDTQIGVFWHIPWPSAEQFSICPQRREVLHGMLGADVVGFNTQLFCNNFIETVGKELEALVNLEQFSITREGHTSHIRSFPISIAPAEESPQAAVLGGKILERLGIRTPHLAIGVDRLDYAKGIPERFRAVEKFLETHPESRGRFTFLQIAAPVREEIEQYQMYRRIVVAEAERVNKRWGTKEWKPIVLETIQYDHRSLEALYRRAEACLITSLHDSMNLVAKEYASARTDEAGVLILSQFAGASRELKGALVVNPYNTEEVAEALQKALEMPRAEQLERMRKMRAAVENYNIYRWAAEFIKAVMELS